MSTKEASDKFVGKTAVFRNGPLAVRVKIINHREVFGRDDLRITPVEGSGEQWVSSDKVTIEK